MKYSDLSRNMRSLEARLRNTEGRGGEALRRRRIMSLIVVRQMSSGGLVRGCYGFAVWEVEQFKTLMWCAGFHYPDFEDSLKLVSEVYRSTNLVRGMPSCLRKYAICCCFSSCMCSFVCMVRCLDRVC